MARKVKADPSKQPFQYPLKRQFVEPDWTRLPGYKDVSKANWESALWQRQHSAKNLKDLKDAWGNDYRYTAPGQGKAYDIVSLGADGKDGGDGENRDITN